jgi:hypothetical protein
MLRRSPALFSAPKKLLALLPLALPGALACDNDHHHEDPPPAPYFDVWEQEPNDASCCPDYLGTLYVGDALVIGGFIRDDGFDPFDGFGFRSGEPMDIEFYLEPVDGWADLDLGVWDPTVGDFVLIWDSPNSVESGVFTIPSALEDFQLVVMSYEGDAEYRLFVWADPPTFFTPESAGLGPTKAGRAVPSDLYGPAENFRSSRSR